MSNSVSTWLTHVKCHLHKQENSKKLLLPLTGGIWKDSKFSIEFYTFHQLDAHVCMNLNKILYIFKVLLQVMAAMCNVFLPVQTSLPWCLDSRVSQNGSNGSFTLAPFVGDDVSDSDKCPYLPWPFGTANTT